jgi:hypothetical protein
MVSMHTYTRERCVNKVGCLVLREMAQVRQRRRVLLIFTIYVLLMRYCSFDLFLVVLFGSYCGILFLMKNSRRVNITLAKR